MLAGLVGVDLVLLGLHVVAPQGPFNLEREGSVSTWWSALQLLLIAILAGACLRDERSREPDRRGSTLVWLAMAAVFSYLAVDEASGLHELMTRWLVERSETLRSASLRVGGQDPAKASFFWVFLLAPFAAAILGWIGFVVVRRLRRSRTAVIAGLSAIGCWTAAIGLEAAVYAMPPMNMWSERHMAQYRVLTTVEETLELLGSSLLIAALAYYRASRRSGVDALDGVCGATPTSESR